VILKEAISAKLLKRLKQNPDIKVVHTVNAIGQVLEIQMPMHGQKMIHMPVAVPTKEIDKPMAIPSNLKLDWHDLRIHTFTKNTLWLYMNDAVTLEFAKVEV
jgi:hypothetical protein